MRKAFLLCCLARPGHRRIQSRRQIRIRSSSCSLFLFLSLASCFSLFFCPPSALRWLRVVVLPPLVEKRLPPPPLFDTPITQEQHAVDLPRIATPGRIATPRAPSVPGRGGLVLWRTSVVLVSESRETGNEKHPCFSSPCPSFLALFCFFCLRARSSPHA